MRVLRLIWYGWIHLIDTYVYIAYNVYMNKIQYTIRNIPPSVDRVIKKRSKQSGKSFNQTVVDLLSLQTFGTVKPPSDNNFNWLFGANTLDDSFDEAVKDLSQIDEKLWQ
jgi:hypothetical protein